MADENIKTLDNKSNDKDGGVLYYYELIDGRTYVGRFQKNDVTSRARDHFYNAVVSGFSIGQSKYHSQSSAGANSASLSYTKISRLESEWGKLMRHNTKSDFKKIFYCFLSDDIKENNQESTLKDIKNRIKESVTIDITRKTYKIPENNSDAANRIEDFNRLFKEKKKKNDKVSEWSEGTNLYQNLKVQKKDKTVNIDQMLFQNKLKFPKSEDIEGIIGLKYFSAITFKVNDVFWKIKDNNIITLINNLNPPENLRNVALGEFLLTALDITSKQNILDSLNDKIGDFNSIYSSFTSSLFNTNQEISSKTDTKIKDSTENSIKAQISSEEIIKLLKKQNQYYTNTQHSKVNYHKKTYKEKPVLVKVNNIITNNISNWINTHSDIKQYWTNNEATSWNREKMLLDNFKYTVKLLYSSKHFSFETVEDLTENQKKYYEKWKK